MLKKILLFISIISLDLFAKGKIDLSKAEEVTTALHEGLMTLTVSILSLTLLVSGIMWMMGDAEKAKAVFKGGLIGAIIGLLSTGIAALLA